MTTDTKQDDPLAAGFEMWFNKNWAIVGTAQDKYTACKMAWIAAIKFGEKK